MLWPCPKAMVKNTTFRTNQKNSEPSDNGQNHEQDQKPLTLAKLISKKAANC